MNPYVEEWIWRFSRVTGIPKYVFLAVGRRMKRTRTGEFQVDVAIKTLVADTGLSYSTVDKNSKAVERAGDLEIVRPKRRGEKLRYRIRRQLHLPLDVDAAVRQSSESVVSLLTEQNDIRLCDDRDRHSTDRTEQNVIRRSDDRAARVPIDRARARTTTTTTTDPDPRSIDPQSNSGGGTPPLAALDAMHHFVAFWRDSFPTYHDGAQSVIDNRPRGAMKRTGLEVVLTLLTLYSEDRLQLMAIRMWTIKSDGVRGSNAEYLTRHDNDHSIFVLDAMAPWLDLEVSREAAAALIAAETADADLDQWQRARRGLQRSLPAHVERVLSILRQPRDSCTPALASVLARIADELVLTVFDVDDRQCAAARLQVLDVEMLTAAFAEPGLGELEAEADAELAVFRPRMPADAYLAARRRAVDRLVRERFKLPTLPIEIDEPYQQERTG